MLNHPARWLYYALMATAGSVAGCFVLYLIAKKGGEAFIRARVKERHIDRTLGVFRRHGLLALVVPSIMPPPMPFKIFILLAGLAEVRPASFVGAMLVGRGFRYFGEALLVRVYGEQAQRYITENLPRVALWAGLVILVAGVSYTLWRARMRRRT